MKFEYYQVGLLQGKKVMYYKGKCIKVVNYVKGLLEGFYIVYNLEGKVFEDLNYKVGKKNGILKYYYDDGILLCIENWNMDVKNGEFKMLYYEQNIQMVENYCKGQKEGWFEEYFFDQKLKWCVFYKKDVLVEEYVWNEVGQEIKMFGGQVFKGNEDDVMLGFGKQKKFKKGKKEELVQQFELSEEKF